MDKLRIKFDPDQCEGVKRKIAIKTASLRGKIVLVSCS
jgi:hypothetical protein